jgi:hypothetical protein
MGLKGKTMNIKLLKQIIKEIQAEPLRFDIFEWSNTCDKIAPCGSTACIAGWAVAIDLRSKGKRMGWKSIVENISNAEDEAKSCLNFLLINRHDCSCFRIGLLNSERCTI